MPLTAQVVLVGHDRPTSENIKIRNDKNQTRMQALVVLMTTKHLEESTSEPYLDSHKFQENQKNTARFSAACPVETAG